MRLQSKKAIAADLATQRKAQIDEGVKLATKVDVLREAVVTEEGKLQRFRTESIATVQADIDRYIDEKDRLTNEIRSLESRKVEAQIPLDVAWQEFREAESKFTKEKQAWGEKSSHLTERQEEIERAEIELENEKDRATDLKRRAAESLASATETLKEAQESAAEIRNKAQVTLMAAESKELEVGIKEKEVEQRAMSLETVHKRQLAKDIEQTNHDKTIKDKYATLERTLKRMGIHG